MKHTLKRLLILMVLVLVTTTVASAASFQTYTAATFFITLQQALDDQLTDFTIQYMGDVEDITDQDIAMPTVQRALATWQPASADNAQVSAYNIFDGTCELDGDLFIFADMVYLCTPEELSFVEQEAETIVASLGLDTATDLVKIKSIYSYVTSNFAYDDTLSRFSAYEGLVEGTMVCQGYALLTSRLLWAVDVPNSIITGTSRSQNHAWNAVEYDGLWYFLDPTWDSADGSGIDGTWNFFMECEDDFTGHYKAKAYQTDTFLDNHPLAEESFPLTEIAICDGDTHVGSLVIRLGISTTFTPGLPEEYPDAEALWTTGDSSLLTVEDGYVTAVGVGTTWLQVASTDEAMIVPNRIAVDVVDMTTLSPWCEDEIVGFYLNLMLPTSLCSDYQSTMTRAELARLTSHFVENTTGLGSFHIKNLYEDMDGNSDIINALRCAAFDLMNGVSETAFEPDSLVTRQEVATVAMRLMEHVNDTEYDVDVADYTIEEGIEDWAKEGLAKAANLGILVGDEDGMRPTDLMTREEVYLVFSRVFATYVPEI